MQKPIPQGAPTVTAPRFYLTGRQPLSPAAILLAIVAAAGVLAAVLYDLAQTGHVSLTSSTTRTANGAPAADEKEDKDDPSQIDTIVLGDPADAPVPGRRRGDHISPVHPTILVRLPRFGEQVGLIPDTAAGRLLYTWLAAFNQQSQPALGNALPNPALNSATMAQLDLRRQTGGFTLLSAKEVQPGVLVFRLHDQTPEATEVLGTLQVRPGSDPAAIASFSLRAVPPAHPATTAAPIPASAPSQR